MGRDPVGLELWPYTGTPLTASIGHKIYGLPPVGELIKYRVCQVEYYRQYFDCSIVTKIGF